MLLYIVVGFLLSGMPHQNTARRPIPMKKRILFPLIALCALLFCNSCARIFLAEAQAPLRHPNTLYFAGTQGGIAASLGILGPAGCALLPVVVPCELAADILFLPADVARHIQYICHPPTNELIRKNDLNALSRHLTHGEDPNAIDFRFFGRNQEPTLPLIEAFHNGTLEAFNLLLDNGAEVPLELFFKRNIYHTHYSNNRFAMLQAAARKGLAKDKVNCLAARGIILNQLTNVADKESSFSNLYPLLSLLLDIGFPPNGKIDPNGKRRTALDHLMEAPPSENKEKLIRLMREHGAMTFAELNESKPKEQLPPEITPQDIPDDFKPVIDILLAPNPYRRRDSRLPYRFSASYPGVEGPVVVVDFQRNDYSFSDKPRNISRHWIQIHHRKTPTQWKQQGEPFDIPAYFRLVLTPLGKRVPSRLPVDLPKKDVLLEEWHTLPTCELYIERPPYMFHRNTDEERVVAKILALAGIPHDVYGKDDRYYFEHDPVNRICKLYYNGNEEDDYNLETRELREEYNWEKKAAAMSKKAGMKGVWLAHTCGSRHYFYSSHRDLRYLDLDSDHRVPYPDEIIAVIPTRVASQITHNSVHDYSKEHKGDYYWNCQVHEFTRKGRITLYYGDEVKEEELNAVVEMTKRIMKW